MNPSDVVPALPSFSWGFGHYGTTVALPDPADEGFFSSYDAMQAAFLGASAAGPALGYNFSQPAQRDAFIQKTVALLFSGGGKEKR